MKKTLTDLFSGCGKNFKNLESGSAWVQLHTFGFGEREVPALPEGAGESAGKLEELKKFWEKLMPGA